MAQIVAWKCEKTKKLFEDKKKYQAHLRKLARDRARERKAAAFELARTAVFVEMRNTVRTPEQLQAFIMANWDKFCMNGYINGSRAFGDKTKAMPTLTAITVKFSWGDHISNSHDCPFSGETNWGNRKPGVPTGYPGWSGDISYFLSEYHRDCGSDMWKGTGINSGSGGYASNFYYSLRLFADDWPAMAESYRAGRQYKQVTQNPRSVDDIVADLFSTAEEVAEFDVRYPVYKERLDRATMWKTLKSDRRSLNDIIKELEGEAAC